MRSKFALLALSLALALLAPRASFATTVTLTLESGSGVPYEFEVNGNPTLEELSCLNNNRTVSKGESWTANAVNVEAAILNNSLISGSGLTVSQLKLDAYLDAQYTSNLTSTTNQEIQDAIWSVLDNSTLSNTSKDVYSGLTTNAEKTAVDNYISAAEDTSEGSSFYSEFTFYIPESWGGNNNPGQIPQQFLGYTPVTPEPSSLLLLGTGILGLAGVMRRRMGAPKA